MISNTVELLRRERQIENMMFQAAVTAASRPIVEAIAGPVRQSPGKKTYKGVGAIPKVRRSTAQRMATRQRAMAYDVIDEGFDLTLEMSGDEFRGDDVLDLARARMPEMQQSVAEHWLDWFVEKLQVGHTGLCYDEQPFFSAAHQEGDEVGAQSNIYSHNVGTPDSPTPVEFADAVWGAITQWSGILDDQGRPANEGRGRDFFLVIPHTMEEVATVALGAENILEGGQGRTNTLRLARRTTFDLESSVRWATGANARTTSFALLLKDRRGMIRQQSMQPERTTLGPASDTYHTEDRLEFGLRFKRGLGYGDWKSGILVNLT